MNCLYYIILIEFEYEFLVVMRNIIADSVQNVLLNFHIPKFERINRLQKHFITADNKSQHCTFPNCFWKKPIKDIQTSELRLAAVNCPK